MFYEAWQPYFKPLNITACSSQTNEIQIDTLLTVRHEIFDEQENINTKANRQLSVGDLNGLNFELFGKVGFTHHCIIITKVKNVEEQLFFIQCCATEFWSKDKLLYNIKNDLYAKRGTLPNNFQITISDPDLRRKALLSFKDEYLLDYINIEEDD